MLKHNTKAMPAPENTSVKPGTNWLNRAVRRPVQHVQQRTRPHPQALPVDTAHSCEIGCTERKRTSVEQHTPTGGIIFPKPTAIGATVPPLKQLAVLINSAEAKHPILVYYEFLIHC